MDAPSRGVEELVLAARSLGLEAGWVREDIVNETSGCVQARVRAWVDDYESARVVALDEPRAPSVPRTAKLILNDCLWARGAFDAVYDFAYRGSTRRTVPAPGTRDPDSCPSQRHLELIDQTAHPAGLYAERGLHACLRALLPRRRRADVYRRGDGGPITSTVTDPALQIHDAWIQDQWSFVVVYDYSQHDGRLAFRACVLDHDRPGRYAWMYGDDLSAPPDPVRWGTDTGQLDIEEPLGTVADRLRYDDGGIGWWGEAPHPTAQ